MRTEPTPLHITREGPRSFIGRNARGAEVRIGGSDADGVFSPGELLHLALEHLIVELVEDELLPAG